MTITQDLRDRHNFLTKGLRGLRDSACAKEEVAYIERISRLTNLLSEWRNQPMGELSQKALADLIERTDYELPPLR